MIVHGTVPRVPLVEDEAIRLKPREEKVDGLLHLVPYLPRPGVLPEERNAMPASAVTATRRRLLARVPNEPSRESCRAARKASPASIACCVSGVTRSFAATSIDRSIFGSASAGRTSDARRASTQTATSSVRGSLARTAFFQRAAGFTPAVFEQHSAHDRKTAGINPAARNARIKQLLGLLLRHSVGIKLAGRTGWRSRS